MGRSVLSVVAGYVVVVVGVGSLVLLLSVVAPGAVEARAPWLLALEAVAGLPVAVAGGLVVMRLAPRAPRRHAAAFAGLLLALGLATLVVEWGAKPAWSILATVVAGPLGVWLSTRLPGAGRP